MEEEKIQQIIYETVDWDGFGMFGVDLAAAEIAKLVDEEFTEAITTALDSYIIQLDAKEAQLAEMADVLAEAGVTLESIDPNAPVIERVDEVITKYMCGTPEVKNGRED